MAADAMIASNQYKEFNPYTAAGRDILRALNSGRLSFEQAKRLRGDFGNRGYELPESLGFRTDDGSKVRDWIQYLNDFRRQEADFAARQTYLSGAATTLAQIFANRNAIGARIAAMQSAVNANNFETVSPADIAGRDFSATLARQYGEGGKYDLGAGKGRLARVAQEYEKARYAQMWWRMQGDKFNADFAKERMNKMEGILVDYGAATEKMNIAAMRSGIDTMTKQLNNLSVRIIGTE